MYTVHAKQGGLIFSCVFPLLSNKTETTYTRFYQKLFNSVNGNDPEDYYWTLKKVRWMLLIIFDHKLKERVAFITYVPMSGNIFRTSRKRYVDCKAWILKIVDGYSNRQVLDYLRNISHNLAFWLWQIHFKQSGPARQSRHRGHVPLPNNGWSIMYFSPFVVFYCCNISRLFILLKI